MTDKHKPLPASTWLPKEGDSVAMVHTTSTGTRSLNGQELVVYSFDDGENILILTMPLDEWHDNFQPTETRDGLYNKYHATRADGRDVPGQKHADCRLFVLDLDCDWAAREVMTEYINLIRVDQPQLAEDLTDLLVEIRTEKQLDEEEGL